MRILNLLALVSSIVSSVAPLSAYDVATGRISISRRSPQSAEFEAAKKNAEDQRRAKYLESIGQGKTHEEATRMGASAHAYTLAKLGNKVSDDVAKVEAAKAYKNAYIPPDPKAGSNQQQQQAKQPEDPKMLQAAEDQRRAKYQETINQGKSHEEATRMSASAHAFAKAKLVHKWTDEAAQAAAAKAYQNAYIPPDPKGKAPQSQQQTPVVPQQSSVPSGSGNTTAQTPKNSTQVTKTTAASSDGKGAPPGVASRLELNKKVAAASVAKGKIGFFEHDASTHEEKGFGRTIPMDINKKKALINGVYSVLPGDKIAAAAIVAFVGVETSGGTNMPTESDQKWRGKLGTLTQEISPIRMGRDMLQRLVAHKLGIKNLNDPKVSTELTKLEILLNSGTVEGYFATGKTFAETVKLYGSNSHGDVSGFFRMFRAGAGGFDNTMKDSEARSSKKYQDAVSAAINTVLHNGLLEGDRIPYFKDGIIPATYGTGRIDNE